MGKCRICGEPHKACGSRTTVTPIDSNITEGGSTMGLKRYEVTVPGRGGGHKTTLLLSDEDAKRAGVFKPEKKPAAKPAEKARTPRNKAVKPAGNKAEAGTDPDASEA